MMFELEQIFAEPLTAKVFLDASAILLAGFALAALWACSSRTTSPAGRERPVMNVQSS